MGFWRFLWKLFGGPISVVVAGILVYGLCWLLNRGTECMMNVLSKGSILIRDNWAIMLGVAVGMGVCTWMVELVYNKYRKGKGN